MLGVLISINRFILELGVFSAHAGIIKIQIFITTFIIKNYKKFIFI